MQFVVARGDLAPVVDDIGAIDPAIVAPVDGERTDRDPDPVFARRSAHSGQDDIVLFAPDVVGCTGAIAIDQTAHFGGEHHGSPAFRSLASGILHK